MNVDVTQLKMQAAYRAVEFIESGMVVGLGHGSTAIHAVRRLAELLQKGQLRDILGVPVSSVIQKEAQKLNIPLVTLEDQPIVDLTFDGADEVDPNLNVIKGGGGALLREKIVAQASRREIIVVDEFKLSPQLGTQWAVPIEVIPFGWLTQVEFLELLDARITVRQDANDEPFMTDQGNLILDCDFGPIADPESLSARLNERVGIVEHGLFLGLATDLIVAGRDGIRHIKRGDRDIPIPG
jgi:ribose 5-phosphate isomerase A